MAVAAIKNLDLRPTKPRPKMDSPYEGARFGRRLATWGPSTAGPNNAIFSSLNILRARARELVRNDPQIDGGLDTLVANLVGTGIHAPMADR